MKCNTCLTEHIICCFCKKQFAINEFLFCCKNLLHFCSVNCMSDFLESRDSKAVPNSEAENNLNSFTKFEKN